MTAPIPFRLPDPAAEADLANRLGVAFRDPHLLRLALTHRSVLGEWALQDNLDAELESNERLEFLGDAVLGMIVAAYLYRTDPDAPEGTLTRLRAAMVRAETLVRWSRELGVPECLYLGTGERVSDSDRDRMLGGAYEALVGAIHLDQGVDAATSFVLRFLERDGHAIREAEDSANPKGRLQELLQEHARPAPRYVSLQSVGPDHAREFTEAVTVDGVEYGTGRGRNRRIAQQEAAREAIDRLNEELS